MKSAFAMLVIATMAVALGCNKSEPGGPGAKSSNTQKPITRAPKNETFKIAAPTLETTVKQGEHKEVTIDVERSADFKQDVTLSFKGDKGVNVTPATATVKASSTDTK